MPKNLSQIAKEFKNRHIQRRRAYAAFTALAILVSMTTMYSLVQPASTMTAEPTCGLEEHTHGEACYTMELVCGNEKSSGSSESSDAAAPEGGEEGHTHGEECYEYREKITCGKSETAGHTHSDACRSLTCSESESAGHTHGGSCYETSSKLTCSESESAGHSHGGGCYDEEGNLTCSKSESAGHSHGSGCYTEEKTLVCSESESAGHTHGGSCYSLTCGQSEGEGHTHDESCKTTEKVLVCKQSAGSAGDAAPSAPSETQGHTHTDACYEKTLTCGKPEHQHVDNCYAKQEKPEQPVAPEQPGQPQGELICDQTAHAHGDACYDEEGNLVCDQTEHAHGDDCYAVEQPVAPEQPTEETYLCGKVAHQHTDDCYDEAGGLICTLEEHEHDETCVAPVKPEGDYICGLEEHTHEDACYDENGELVCGMEEHTHDETCVAPVKPEGDYICGLEEHTHEDACYDENGELICGMKEHTHDETCVAPAVLLPEGVPEGYTDMRTFEDSKNGFAVTVYAPEGVIPEDVTLVAELLPENSDAYAKAAESLEASEQVEGYEGFVALDIRLEDAAGKEFEPEIEVYVDIQAISLLPADIDPETVAVQHHVETEADKLLGFVPNPFADAAVTVEVVADSTANTGDVTVLPAQEATDVVATFSVESFSTFTITWNTWTRSTNLTVTCLEQLPNNTTAAMTAAPDGKSLFDGRSISFTNANFRVEGYTFHHATVNGKMATWIKADRSWGNWWYDSDALTSETTTKPTVVLYYTKTVSVAINTDEVAIGKLTAEPSALEGEVTYVWYNTDDEQVSSGVTLEGVTNGQTLYVVATDEDGRVATSAPYTVSGVNQGVVSRELSYSKFVEALEDGSYDLNLTVSGAVGTEVNKALIDIVLIFDKSNSMGENNNRLLSACKTAATTLINTIAENTGIDARYSVVTFSGSNSVDAFGKETDAQILYSGNASWYNGSTAITKINGISTIGGTNYQAGIRKGNAQLGDARPGAQKVMIFLTDGEPTFSIGNAYGDSSTAIARHNEAAVGEIKNGTYATMFYCVGAGSAFTGSGSSTARGYLQDLCDAAAENGAQTGVYAAGSSDLQQTFANIAGQITSILCTDVTITDVLSAYVEPVAATGTTPLGALTVTVTTTDDSTPFNGQSSVTGNTVRLPATENNSATTLTPVYHAETKQLQLSFGSSYTLEPNYEYKVTLKIQPTEAAYTEFAGSGYPHVGDEGTGTTSAGQPGFYSNVVSGSNRAKVDYIFDGKRDSRDYQKPVVQLELSELVIDKTVSGLDAASLEELDQNLVFEVKDSGGTVVATVAVNGDQNPAGVVITEHEEGDGWTVRVPNLRAGTYTVTESGHNEFADYVLVTSGDNASVTTATGTAGISPAVTASLVNNYAPASGNMAITKMVTVSDEPQNGGSEEFQFEVKLPVAFYTDERTLTATYARQGETQTHSGNPEFVRLEAQGGATVTDPAQALYAVYGLKLYAGETATIAGLPIGTQVIVTETGFEGYSPKWSNTSGVAIGDENSAIASTADATVTTAAILSSEAIAITCTNSTGPRLPNTGGIGTRPFVILGTLMTFGAGALLLGRGLRRKEGMGA